MVSTGFQEEKEFAAQVQELFFPGWSSNSSARQEERKDAQGREIHFSASEKTRFPADGFHFVFAVGHFQRQQKVRDEGRGLGS